MVLIALFLYLTEDPPPKEEHEIRPPPEVSPY